MNGAARKKAISSANPWQRISILLQGKGSGDMDFLQLPKCFTVPLIKFHPHLKKKKKKCGGALEECVFCVCA